MKSILACSLIAAALVGAAPAMAQSFSVGPDGVGVDVGRPHYRDYDRDRAYRPYREDEGRSAYRDRDYRYRRDYDDR